MKLFIRKGLLALFMISGIFSLRASHFYGIEMEFECVSSCTTRLHLVGYYQCGGAVGWSPGSVSVTPDGPGCLTPSPITGWDTLPLVDVTPLSPGMTTNCTDTAAVFSGIMQFELVADYDFCSSGGCGYTFTWDHCCRNYSITSGPTSQDAFIKTYYSGTGAGSCNNSPEFAGPGIYYLCQGQSFEGSFGAYDPDGDSLVYSLDTCRVSPGIPFVYNPSYSPYAPLGPSWAITIDPSSGNMTADPVGGSIVSGPVCIKVEEYRAGSLIGTYWRDLQLSVLNCPSNTLPAFSLSNPSDPANMTISGYEVWIDTAGGSFCFDIDGIDPDTSDSLTMMWDISLAGATLTDTTGSGSDTIMGDAGLDGTFCWTPPGTGTYYFLVTLQDNFPPIVGEQETMITLHVGATPGFMVMDSISSISCLDVDFGATAAGGTPPYTYSWSGTGGLSGTGSTLSHTYSGPGTYSYTLTVTDALGMTVTGSGSVTVGVDITGTATTTLGANIIDQLVILVAYDTTGGGTLTSVDSTYTDSLGQYSFGCVTDSCVFVKLIPDSADYPSVLPTYAYNTAFWGAADTICPGTGTVLADIRGVWGINPGGPGFIGGLVSMGAGKTYGAGVPVPNLDLILWNTDSDEPVMYTRTDASGEFEFTGIAYGNYAILADKPGVSFETDDNPNLTVDSSEPIRADLSLELFSTHLAFETSAVLEDLGGLSAYWIRANRNPVGGASMDILFGIPGREVLSIRLVDLSGRTLKWICRDRVFAGGGIEKIGSVDLSMLSEGVYFLEMRGINGRASQKVLILD